MMIRKMTQSAQSICPKYVKSKEMPVNTQIVNFKFTRKVSSLVLLRHMRITGNNKSHQVAF